MLLLDKIKAQLNRHNPASEINPEDAYNLWAHSYDAQPGNLMLEFDEEIFTGLLNSLSIENKVVIDIGCGTGRHWGKIISKQPYALKGYDVSIEMLNKLKEKYPGAKVFQLQNNILTNEETESCDVIISTLAVAHIENISAAFSEWHRLLKKGGSILITDYHPEALSKGANRTFVHDGQTVAIKNYVHSLEKIHEITDQLGFKLAYLTERVIDNSVRHYYEEKQALPVFNKFKGVPIIYGMHLRKNNAAA